MICSFLLLILTISTALYSQVTFQQLPGNISATQNIDFYLPTDLAFDLEKKPFSWLTKITIMLYQKWSKIHTNTISQNYRIPPIIHQIWLGSKLPDRFKPLIETWKQMHPGWLYKLWTDEDVKELRLHNQEMYDLASNFGEKADILRYELLYMFGGVYVDIDFECIKSVDVLHTFYDFYAGLCGTDSINNAIIGTAPGNEILKYCIERLPLNKHITYVPSRTGPDHFSHCIATKLFSFLGRAILLPSIYFYPPIATGFFDQIHRNVAKSNLSSKTFAIHYWAASWIDGSQKNFFH